jgi:phosphoribosylaminoimidazole carboxylase PurE protein
MTHNSSRSRNSVPAVGIIMGSQSDLPYFLKARETLERFGVPYEIRIGSAHRTPEQVGRWAAGAAGRGLQAIIAGAGAAAHLAGVIAAHTTLPVLGVPLPSSPLKGIDSLLSTAQMPAGIPVATLAIGEAGATNAAVLAIEILALHDDDLRRKLADYRKGFADKIDRVNTELSDTMGGE